MTENNIPRIVDAQWYQQMNRIKEQATRLKGKQVYGVHIQRGMTHILAGATLYRMPRSKKIVVFFPGGEIRV